MLKNKNRIKKAERRNKKGSFIRNSQLLIMCLPAIIKIFVFSYITMFGIIIAFKSYSSAKGILGSPWNGLKNFEFFFKSNTAWSVLRNTIGLNMACIILAMIVNVILALLLYEIMNRYFLKAYQTILFIPFFFSWVLVGLMLTVFLSPTSGALTELVFHLTGKEINFYTEPAYWRVILPIVYVWKGAGFGSLIYYSSLMGLNKEFFEAAAIDGASKLQRIRFICLPHLAPLMSVMTIIAIGNIMRADFGLFYFVPRNTAQLYQVTDVIDTYIYRALIQKGDFGMSSAVGVFQSVIGFIMILATNKIAKSVDKDYSLF